MAPRHPTHRLQLTGAPQLTAADGAAPPLRLPGRRALALLAAVAVDGPSTRARLVALLWPDLDEPSARRNLRRELARLRDAGLGALLAGDEVLTLGPGLGCDVVDFDAALAQADPELALAIRRGPLLDGFGLDDAAAFETWLRDRRDALQRRWRDAAVAAARARELGGDLRGALELRLRLVEADPLREAEAAEAMRLHERLGDRSAALALYERLRRGLADELGLEPLAETQALAERLQAGARLAPVLRAPAPSWARLDAPLVGRDAEARALRDAPAAVLLVEGEPGVGKTRLVQECVFAHRSVLLRCSALGRGAPLQPVAEVLAETQAVLARAAHLAGLAATTRHELARLVPAFDPGAATATPTPAPASLRHDPAAERRFLDALADALDALTARGAAAAAGAGTVLVDDVHWADEATLALLRHLAHRRARDPAAHPRVVATARSAELADEPAAQALVRALEREGLLQRLPLAPLSEDATLALVRELSGAPGGALFARRLQRSTAGNPFHLLETLRFLLEAGELQFDEDGGWRTRYDDATADYAELPVPPTVTQTVLERIDRLGAPARRVLEAAALAGDGFTLDDVQPATALSEFEALDGLERALQARLIAAVEPGYRFVHDLARGAIDARLAPERRRRVHARLAQGLVDRAGRGDRAARSDRIAAHLEGAGERAAAVPWRLRAVAEAERVFARREALAHLDAALADDPSAADEIECRYRRALQLRSLGEFEATDAEIERLAECVERGGDAAARYRVQLLRAMRAHDRARFTEARQRCEALLAATAPRPADRLHALRMGGFAALHQDRGTLAERWLGEALALARELRAPERDSIAANLVHLRVSAGDIEAALALLAELEEGHAAGDAAGRRDAADPADPGPSPLERAMLDNAAMRALEAAGRRADARARLDAALAGVRAAQAPLFIGNFLANRARLEIEDGEPEAARATLAELEALEGPVVTPRQRYVGALMQARLAWAEGRCADALAGLDAAVATLQGDPGATSNAHALLARYRLLGGDVEGARAAAAAAAAAVPDEQPPQRLLLAEAVFAAALLAAGDAAGACERLRAALAGPTALDEFWALHRDFAACVLGSAALAGGDAAAACTAVANVRWSPALQALALAVRVAAGDAAAGPLAKALLAAGRVPPVERARLETALAGGRPPR